MPIVLPTLPNPALDETSPYCVIAKHRAKPGRADAYEKRMLVDLENTRAEPGARLGAVRGCIRSAVHGIAAASLSGKLACSAIRNRVRWRTSGVFANVQP
jgi:hypothetical protein